MRRAIVRGCKCVRVRLRAGTRPGVCVCVCARLCALGQEMDGLAVDVKDRWLSVVHTSFPVGVLLEATLLIRAARRAASKTQDAEVCVCRAHKMTTEAAERLTLNPPAPAPYTQPQPLPLSAVTCKLFLHLICLLFQALSRLGMRGNARVITRESSVTGREPSIDPTYLMRYITPGAICSERN